MLMAEFMMDSWPNAKTFCIVLLGLVVLMVDDL